MGRTYDLVLAALLAVARALVGLHLCGAAALHADRRADAVAYRGLQQAFDIFKPLGFAKLEKPNGLQRQVDIMDGRHPLLLATGIRSFGSRIARRRNWLNSVGQLSDYPRPAAGPHPEGFRRTKIRTDAIFA